MPYLSGVFDNFKILSHCNVDDIKRWLSFPTEPHQVENFLSNRLLYPQSIPMNEREMEIDLAILREALRISLTTDKKLAKLFYDDSKKKIFLDEAFLLRFAPSQKLVWALSDVLVLSDVTNIFIRQNSGEQAAGSILAVQALKNGKVSVEYNYQRLNLNVPSKVLLPSNERSAKVKIGDKLIDATGGNLGIFINLKIKNEK